jgi:hypothetical protein
MEPPSVGALNACGQTPRMTQCHSRAKYRLVAPALTGMLRFGILAVNAGDSGAQVRFNLRSTSSLDVGGFVVLTFETLETGHQ